MQASIAHRLIVTATVVLLLAPAWCLGQRGRGGPGRGGGPPNDPAFVQDRDVFHFLLANHKKITRTVKNTANGVETVTESTDPEVAKKIQEHVDAMYLRVEEGRPIHRRDPLFDVVFRHADKIRMEKTATEKGIRVVETSDDPFVVKLIQAHAKVVSKFVENGFDEAFRNHEVPSKDKPVSSWKPVTNEELANQHAQQFAQAVAARDTLFNGLVDTLQKELEDNPPEKAISVCKTVVPEIAQTAMDRHRAAIGRTSFKLRNPYNMPPEWAKEFVKDRVGKTQAAVDSHGTLGVLLPIRLKQTCLQCHGSPEEIPAMVKQELKKLYPQDEAVGFAVDELRGYFWVEVPAKQ